jgi:CheY-like chemotaxis protein
MSDLPAAAAPAASGWLRGARTWLNAWSHEIWPSSASLEPEAGGHGRHPVHFHNSARVLVVDDNPVNLMLISAQMEARGLLPLLAGDGAEAVALACELGFDLILMDLQMPILDGYRATSAIRSFELLTSRAPVPVVAYTSLFTGPGVLAQHGLNDCLNKPCGERELEDCLVRWCPTYRPSLPFHGGGKG